MKVTTDACLFGAWAADDMKHIQPASVLDIGTGTGLLALMTAQACADTRIDAVELDPAAAMQATENFNAAPWADRTRSIQADIRTIACTEKYDAIICNPPFYENELSSPDAGRNLAHHAGGLFLGELMPLIAAHLKENGYAYLLLPAKRQAEIPGILVAAGLKADQWVRVKQTAKHDPFRIMIRCRHMTMAAGDPQEAGLVIAEADGSYTGPFTELLKDYYLYL